jgi:hypothetical protein
VGTLPERGESGDRSRECVQSIVVAMIMTKLPLPPPWPPPHTQPAFNKSYLPRHVSVFGYDLGRNNSTTARQLSCSKTVAPQPTSRSRVSKLKTGGYYHRFDAILQVLVNCPSGHITSHGDGVTGITRRLLVSAIVAFSKETAVTKVRIESRC